jgi:predicted aspartyl protease
MTENMFLALAASTALLLVVCRPECIHATEAPGQSSPLLDDGVMIRVPVGALGKTLYFQVDTGFTVSAMDMEYASSLGGRTDTCSGASPLGTPATLPAFRCPAMSLAGRPLNLDKILGLDLQMARWVSGQPCDGVLGLDAFTGGIISLDFDHHQFTRAMAVPENVKHTYSEIPLDHSAHSCSVQVLINQRQRLKLVVDTGDSSSISLNPADWREVFGDRQTNFIGVTVADAIRQTAQSKTGVIRRLTIGNLVYPDLHATFIQNAGQPSHLGLGFFRRNNATFDYAHRRLYLRPRQNSSRSDQEDMSGLHLLRADGKTLVYSVDQNSPAFYDGIKADDIISAVNGQNASSLSMRDIRCLLQTRDGDKVALQVRRGQSVFDATLLLKKAI